MLPFVYEKSAKKSRELLDIVDNMKKSYNFSKGGQLTVRAQGS